MRIVVFVGGGLTEFRVARLLRFLRFKASVFRPTVTSDGLGHTPGDLQCDALPLPGSVVQTDFNRVFGFFEDRLRFLHSDERSLGRVLGIDSGVLNVRPEEMRVALTSRVASSSWEAAYLAHFVRSATESVLLVTRSARMKAVLKNSFEFKTLNVPRPSLRKVSRIIGRGRGTDSMGIAATESARLRSSDEVAVLEHKGSSYGQLYKWSQYDGDRHGNDQDFGNLPRLSYSSIDYRSLSRRQLIRCVLETAVVAPRAFFVLPRCPRGLRGTVFAELLRLGFEVRSSRRAIRKNCPDLRVSLFAYDMLVPPSLSIALAAEGIWRVATLERPNVHLTGLPILVDDWLVPMDESPQNAKMGSAVCFRRLIRVGYWRTDFFFDSDFGQGEELDVMVLPYHVDDLPSNDTSDPFTSWRVFEHFISSVIELCDQYPDLRFLLRAKNDSWMTNPKLEGCIRKMRETSNLVIDLTYGVDGRSYHLAKSARVVIGKYTSMMEEVRSFGKPVVIHNFNQFQSHDFAEGNLGLPWTYFAQDQEQFLSLFRDALSKPLDEQHPMDSCDGHVKLRIREHVDAVLSDLRGSHWPLL